MKARVHKRGRRWLARVARPQAGALTCSFATRSEAESWARMMARLIAAGHLPDLATTTVGDLVERFVSEDPASTRSRFSGVLRSSLARLPLAELSEARLVAYREAQLGIRTPGDVAGDLEALSQVIARARVAWGFPFSGNPLRRARSGRRRGAGRAPSSSRD